MQQPLDGPGKPSGGVGCMRTWTQWLGPLVPGLPSFETVINSLRPQVEALVSTGDAGWGISAKWT